MRNLLCLSSGVLATLLLSANAQPQTLVEIVVENDNLTTLEAAVIKADLVDTLSSDGPFTVFAPTDEAFAAVDQGFLTKLTTVDGWMPHLTEILLFHVTGSQILAEDISDGAEVTMASDEVLMASVSDEGAVALSSEAGAMASVTAVDIAATNGVAHVIDTVLLPSFMFETLYSLAAGNPAFSTLVSVLDKVGLNETLMMGEYTVLAPTNDAFNALDTETLDAVLADDDLLTRVLLYHVIPGVVPAAAVTTGDVTTADETTVAAMVGMDGGVMFNDASVTTANLLASNGIVHVIDKVLIPPEKVTMAPVVAATSAPVAAAATSAPVAAPTDSGSAAFGAGIVGAVVSVFVALF